MENVFGKNLKIFKSTTLGEVHWSDELEDLKLLVLAIMMEAQQDLIIASALSNYSTEKLRDRTRITLKDDIKKFSDGSIERDYTVKTVTFRFPDDFYKPQSVSFISNLDNTKNKTYDTLILVNAFPKLANLMFQWLQNNYGVITAPLSFKSPFIVNTLNFIINGLSDQFKLGDVELAFQVTSSLNLLSNIGIEISNPDIIRFAELIKDKQTTEGEDVTLLDEITDYLETQTSIYFKKLNITKLKCNFIIITSEGKVKFLKNVPELGRTHLINFTIWDFIHRIYETI